MIDVELSSSGDFIINQTKEGNYELVIDDNPILSLLKRAVQTPKGYISRYVLDKQGLYSIDKSFGNEIYKELSEGLTINFISRVKQHVVKAVSLIETEVKVINIDVNVIGLETVAIVIQFEDSVVVNIDIPL